MRRKIILILTLLLIADVVFGKNGNRNKQIMSVHKNSSNSKNQINIGRVKRSLDGGAEKILKIGKENIIDDSNQYDHSDGRGRDLKLISTVEKESPFWGNRGRRESSSDEKVPDVQLPTPKLNKLHNKNLYNFLLNFENKLDDEVLPFWSNRGKRQSYDPEEDDPLVELFWANRGRRQDNDPFWGTRGRRQEEEVKEPFWANRGRRDLISQFPSSRKIFDDDEPFWGNRGRRQEQEPFWGNRGRRESFEPYSDHVKNKLKLHHLYNDVSINQKKYLTDSIPDAIDGDRDNDDNFERKRREYIQSPFWVNRGRNSKIRSILNGIARNRMRNNPNTSNKHSTNELHSKTFQQNTVHDDRIYAEEPHYILVERSSRSSGEDDPFFISRGKKYGKSNLVNAVRGRRGALEDIMKSVRNDPYNIVRGKKDYIQIGRSNTTESQFIITRDLICATVDLLMMKHSEGNKVKRELFDNDRDRRTILKKLALQLQTDPYFVSRGKKVGENTIDLDDLEQLINKVIILCNSN